MDKQKDTLILTKKVYQVKNRMAGSKPITNFSVMISKKVGEEYKTVWLNCLAWGDYKLVEKCEYELKGYLSVENYTGKNGEVTKLIFVVQEIGGHSAEAVPEADINDLPF